MDDLFKVQSIMFAINPIWFIDPDGMANEDWFEEKMDQFIMMKKKISKNNKRRRDLLHFHYSKN